MCVLVNDVCPVLDWGTFSGVVLPLTKQQLLFFVRNHCDYTASLDLNQFSGSNPPGGKPQICFIGLNLFILNINSSDNGLKQL